MALRPTSLSMTRIDQFESVFKAAVKTVFSYEELRFASGLVVTDLDEAGATEFGDRVRGFLTELGLPPELTWRDVHGAEFRSAEDLLHLVEREAPDLICTYRSLHSGGWKWGHTLGEHVDVLTQVAHLPRARDASPGKPARVLRARSGSRHGRSLVMAITDHLAGRSRGSSTGPSTSRSPGGRLLLAHVEDEQTFDRYLDVISKIAGDRHRRRRAREHAGAAPEGAARTTSRSCAAALAEKHGVELVHRGDAWWRSGRHLDEYKSS